MQECIKDDDVIAVCPSYILNKMQKILQLAQEHINADVVVGGGVISLGYVVLLVTGC